MPRPAHGQSKAPRRLAAVLATVALVAIPAAPGSRTGGVAHAASVDNGTFVAVINGTAADIDPASEESANSNMVQRNIDEQLIAPKGRSLDQYVPVLASSWSSNARKTVWTFHLRHGVKFHSGREMTAADVKYSWVRMLKAGLSNTYVFARFMTNPDKQIKALDRYTVECDLALSQPLFLGGVVQEYASSILDSVELAKHVVKNDYGHAYAMTHDLGTGPYTLQDWQHGQQVTLAKFAGYWGGWAGPHFSKVIIRTVPEATTRRELLERGQANLTGTLTPQDYAAMAHEKGVKLDVAYTTQVEYMTMTQGGALASPLARQALSYAFDYNAYLKAAYGTYARRSYGPIPSVLLGYDPSMFHYQTDLAKAKALFAQAGVPQGTTLTFAHVAGTVRDRIVIGVLTAQLGQIGITIKDMPLSEDSFNTIFYGNDPPGKRPDLMTFAWWPDYNDPWDMSNILINSKSAGSSGANAGFYHNAAVDRLLAASVNADAGSLVRNFRTIQDITGRQDPPSIWLSEPAQVTVLTSDIQGLVVNPLEVLTYSFYQLHK